ncbi:MAG: Flp family type IVb pilin [Hyphomonas sp.]
MTPLKDCLRRYRADQRGATAIEYGMIMALIFLAIVGSVTAMTDANNDVYDSIETAIVERA